MKKHIHRYEKREWGKKRTIIWRCVVPSCTHYLHAEFIFGRDCACYKCGKTFQMDYSKLLRIRPKCDDCQHKSGQGGGVRKERKVPNLKYINIDDLLENL